MYFTLWFLYPTLWDREITGTETIMHQQKIDYSFHRLFLYLLTAFSHRIIKEYDHLKNLYKSPEETRYFLNTCYKTHFLLADFSKSLTFAMCFS